MKIPFLGTLKLWDGTVASGEERQAREGTIENVQVRPDKSWLMEVMRAPDQEDQAERPRSGRSMYDYAAR